MVVRLLFDLLLLTTLFVALLTMEKRTELQLLESKNTEEQSVFLRANPKLQNTETSFALVWILTMPLLEIITSKEAFP